MQKIINFYRMIKYAFPGDQTMYRRRFSFRFFRTSLWIGALSDVNWFCWLNSIERCPRFFVSYFEALILTKIDTWTSSFFVSGSASSSMSSGRSDDRLKAFQSRHSPDNVFQYASRMILKFECKCWCYTCSVVDWHDLHREANVSLRHIALDTTM